MPTGSQTQGVCSLSRHSPYTSKSTDRRFRASSTRLSVALSVHGSLLTRKLQFAEEKIKMTKRKIDVTEYANVINKELERGVFLTTKASEKVNSMVIGWGHIGRIWERPVFIAFIRDSRYSREMLDANPEFTVNVPINGFNKKAFAVCGTKSGRDMDKITEAGLTLVDPEKISVPAIREFPLTLECRVIYRQEQNAASLPEEIRRQFYTIETEDHITYYGEIVDAYIIED